MNDVFVPAAVDLKPLLATAHAPLALITKTIQVKIRSESWDWFNQAAKEVNTVWNWANETSRKAVQTYVGKAQWLSGFDLNNLSAGAAEGFDRIGADVIQSVNAELATRRRQYKRVKLRFRKSTGSQRSLGWIPFKAPNIRLKVNRKTGKTRLVFLGKAFRIFNDSYYFNHRNAGSMKAGNFAQNRLGEWFLNQTVEIPYLSLPALGGNDSKLGIDLGTKTSATLSETTVDEAGNIQHVTLNYAFYRQSEQKLAQLQRRGHKRQSKYLARTIKNQRREAIRRDAARLIQTYSKIYIGDISSIRMKRRKKGGPKFGKAVSDAAWGMLNASLKVKGHWAVREVRLVNERFTTQACSNCGSRTGPKGLRQLAVRIWQCTDCETVQDRDGNSAINMIHAPLSKKDAEFQPKNRLPLAGTR